MIQKRPGMSGSVPGLGETTVSYSGPPELRSTLPAHDPEMARRLAREVLHRTANYVANAEAAVSRLAPGYPTSFDATLMWLKAQNLKSLDAASRDPFAALAEVRVIGGRVEDTASALIASARGISSRMGRIR